MPKQILLVDDSVTIKRVVELTFAHEPDYKVVAAKSHDEGLAKARDLRPDIVLADAGLQGKTGYDLCAALRSDGGLAGTPVLILTGNFSPYDEARGSKAGADGYVVKPFETQALIDKVADAINRKGSRATAQPAAAAPAPAPPPPSRKDDSLEISIEGGETVRKPAAAPTPAPAARPAAPAPPAPPPPAAKPPTAPPMARTMMGMQAPTPPAAPPTPPPKPMVPEALSKPLSLVEPARPAPPPPVAAPVSSPQGSHEQPQSSGGRTPMAPPKPAAAAASAAMPQAVPTMPRSPLIPNVPTPAQPAAAHKAVPPRATLMGIPTVNPANLPPGTVALPPTNKPAAPWAPPVPSSPPAPTPPVAATPPTPAASLVSAVADRAVAEIGARGADHEAVAQMSREIIERIAWEVVPELAETIIREQLDRLVAERQK